MVITGVIGLGNPCQAGAWWRPGAGGRAGGRGPGGQGVRGVSADTGTNTISHEAGSPALPPCWPLVVRAGPGDMALQRGANIRDMGVAGTVQVQSSQGTQLTTRGRHGSRIWGTSGACNKMRQVQKKRSLYM